MAIGRSPLQVGAFVLLIAAAAACNGSGASSRTAGPTTTAPASSSIRPSQSASAQATEVMYREVEFTSRDGTLRSGHLYGEGSVAIVLSHMGRQRDRQEDWDGAARHLADRGYQVLTYTRQAAFGESWQEVLDAADYLRQQGGAERVVAGGASIGAMASLFAAEQPESQLVGVIWLAGVLHGSRYDFQEADVSQIACPMLMMSGAKDGYGGRNAAEQLYAWATAPKELLIVESGLHGTDILLEGGPQAAQLEEAIDGFLNSLANPHAFC